MSGWATHDGSVLLLLQAIDRHLFWAYEFASAGEYEAAMDELDDAHAIATEIDCPVAA